MNRGGALWHRLANRRVAFTATYTDHISSGKLVEHQGGSNVSGLLEQLAPPSGDA
jgi:hypothetical protein